MTLKDNSKLDRSLFYTVDPSKWYKTFPYYFEIREAVQEQSVDSIYARDLVTFNKQEAVFTPCMRFYLPVPPQHMALQQLPATEATATMGGVVEETTDPIFHTITLAGTTGMSLRSEGVATDGDQKEIKINQRREFEEMAGTGSLFGRVAFTATEVADSTANLITPENSLPFARFGSAVNTPDSKDLNKIPQDIKDTITETWWERIKAQVSSGLFSSAENPTLFSNGYAWDHALRQFFLIYQREKAKKPNDFRLVFVDVKSNTEYSCIPRAIQFTKSANNPFVSNYNIVLKCWDLADLSKDDLAVKFNATDRFNGDLGEVYSVNATAIFGEIQNIWVELARVSSKTGWAENTKFLADRVLGSFFS